MMAAMAKRSGRKKRVITALVIGVLLVGLAVALGSLWSLYRAYPYKWQDEIKANAALYGQDPLFIAAVIRTESSWRESVMSSVGAAGLMQIMPETGEWIAGKNGWEYSDGMLYHGADNIRLGCWYIDYLSKKFGGDTRLILAAYNAGENKVEDWIAEGRMKDGGAGIPYSETANFVKRVLDAYDKYKMLYKFQ